MKSVIDAHRDEDDVTHAGTLVHHDDEGDRHALAQREQEEHAHIERGYVFLHAMATNSVINHERDEGRAG
tara:strand:+ start:440 stop:649 length:210 start_codon:yes stop_codon:yes gene_type:complete